MKELNFEQNSLEHLIKTSDVVVDSKNGLAVVVIKPDAFVNKGLILKKLENSGLYVVKTVTKKLPDNFVIGEMYKDLPKGIEEETLRHFNEGASELVLLEGGSDILQKIILITGEKTNPAECDEKSIRYLFGDHFGHKTADDGVYFRNAIHRAKDKKEKTEDLDKFESFF